LRTEEIKVALQNLFMMENRELLEHNKKIQLNKLPDRIKQNALLVKNKIWNESGHSVFPSLVCVEDAKTRLEWDTLRHFTSSAPWCPPPNKMLRFLVIDELSGKYLGIISLNSPFAVCAPLDRRIGWDTVHRKANRDLLMVCSTIVPTQPFGYNTNGGKLLALLCGSNTIRNAFRDKYGYDLLGIYTTSLFGGFSMYSRLKNWHYCGETNGGWIAEPTGELWEEMVKIIRVEYPNEYAKYKINRRKQNLVSFYCRANKIDMVKHNHKRGVYYCQFYKNTNAILRGEVEKENKGELLFSPDENDLITLWREKYLSKRVGKSGDFFFLQSDNNNKLNTFFAVA